jgi:NADPH:quinone reductase-like Zn-dependent oxidoreductase
MKALVITEHGPPDVLRVQERPDPEPGPGEVRIRVRAAGVNFADLLGRVGLYPDAPKPPCVVGYEVAGDVDAIGEGVEGLELGQRVMGACRFGGYAQLAVAKTGTVLPLPDGWSYSEGAAMPVTYATAYAGLVRFGGLAAGERVLIQAAAGGVGIAATQIAKLIGAEVYGTASPGKHDAIRGFGVDHAVDYRTHDVVDEVRRIAGEKHPIDLALDAIGGRSFRQSFSLLRAGGRLVCFGASEVQAGERRSPLRALRVIAQMPLQPAEADERVEVRDRAEHAHALGRAPVARRADRPTARVGRRGQAPARGGAGVQAGRRRGGAPLHARAQQRRQGRLDALAGRG